VKSSSPRDEIVSLTILGLGVATGIDTVVGGASVGRCSMTRGTIPFAKSGSATTHRQYFVIIRLYGG